MKTILVPIDFSEVSNKTAATAFSLVQDIHVNLVFLHVIDPQAPVRAQYPVPGGTSVSDAADELRPTKRLMNLVHRAQTQGIIATYRLVHGTPVAQILEQAKQLRADLIVMGSHDYGSTHGSTVGGTTKGVLYATPCPIVIVPSDRIKIVNAGADLREMRVAS